jgi:uncharacterized small protein (DUF1192 family)
MIRCTYKGECKLAVTQRVVFCSDSEHECQAQAEDSGEVTRLQQRIAVLLDENAVLKAALEAVRPGKGKANG